MSFNALSFSNLLTIWKNFIKSPKRTPEFLKFYYEYTVDEPVEYDIAVHLSRIVSKVIPAVLHDEKCDENEKFFLLMFNSSARVALDYDLLKDTIKIMFNVLDTEVSAVEYGVIRKLRDGLTDIEKRLELTRKVKT